MIHKDGLRFIIPSILITIWLSYWHIPATILTGAITIWIIYFFRNPKHYIANLKNSVVAAADGKIVSISTAVLPEEIRFTKKKVTKISTFLNLFDAHVTAIPVSGKVIDIKYHPGQFLNASFDKASELNERNSVVIEYEDGKKLAVVQIAGLIARRIRCDIKVGDEVTQGQIFGLIRFGSRVDIYFDKEIKPLVTVGQKVRFSESILSYQE